MRTGWIAGRIFFALAAGMFLLGGILQWNDPDWPVWMTLYLVAGVCCGITAAGWRVPPALIALLAAATGGYAAYLAVLYFGGYSATPMYGDTLGDNPAWFKIEEAREMGGLIVVTAVVLAQLALRPLTPKASAPGERQHEPP